MKGARGPVPRVRLSVVQDRQILHYGDQAIAIYRGVVSGDRHLQGVVGPDLRIRPVSL